MAMRTISLKLHEPSNAKRVAIDEAIDSYSRAYRYLLNKAYGELDDIKSRFSDETGKFRAVRVAGWIGRAAASELNQFGIEPFKDSLKLDFGMTLAAYLNTEGKRLKVSYPLSEELSEEGKAKGRPLYFCRYSTNRDFCLLYDKEHQKYYAKLYLMNNKNQNRKVLLPSGKRELVYIHKDSKTLEQSSRKVRFLLFPLSFGQWQEDYLKAGLENPDIFKTARLTKKGEDYFLSVNIFTEEPEKVETLSYMGVARGLESPMNFTVTTLMGEVSGNGRITLPGIKRNARNTFSAGELHKLANEIVDRAFESKARVIVEKLADKGDRLQWTDSSGRSYIPVLGCRDYNRVVKLLEYKLPARGLPVPVEVSPAGIFSTCPQCGRNAKQNRFSQDLFICTACGKTGKLEGLGSHNLARRLPENGKIPIRIRAERVSGSLKLENPDLGLECSIPLQQNVPPILLPSILNEELEKLIRSFNSNLGIESRKAGFNKKYSLVKRLQQCEDRIGLIQLVD